MCKRRRFSEVYPWSCSAWNLDPWGWKAASQAIGNWENPPNFRKQWRFIAWNICTFLVCWKCLGQTARIEHGKGFSALDDILQYLVGGLEHDFYEFPYIGNNIPNWRAHIFQRGRYSTNQICSNLVLCIVSYGHNLKPRLSGDHHPDPGFTSEADDHLWIWLVFTATGLFLSDARQWCLGAPEKKPLETVAWRCSMIHTCNVHVCWHTIWIYIYNLLYIHVC